MSTLVVGNRIPVMEHFMPTCIPRYENATKMYTLWKDSTDDVRYFGDLSLQRLVIVNSAPNFLLALVSTYNECHNKQQRFLKKLFIHIS